MCLFGAAGRCWQCRVGWESPSCAEVCLLSFSNWGSIPRQVLGTNAGAIGPSPAWTLRWRPDQARSGSGSVLNLVGPITQLGE